MKKVIFFINKFFKRLSLKKGKSHVMSFLSIQLGNFKLEIKVITNAGNTNKETSTYNEDSKRTRRKIGFNQDLDVGPSKYSSIDGCIRKVKMRDEYWESSKYTQTMMKSSYI